MYFVGARNIDSFIGTLLALQNINFEDCVLTLFLSHSPMSVQR